MHVTTPYFLEEAEPPRTDKLNIYHQRVLKREENLLYKDNIKPCL